MQSERDFWKSVDSGLYHMTTEDLEYELVTNDAIITLAVNTAGPMIPLAEREAMTEALISIRAGREAPDVRFEEFESAFENITDETHREVAKLTIQMSHRNAMIAHELKSREETA
jgi:hypothetical protein